MAAAMTLDQMAEYLISMKGILPSGPLAKLQAAFGSSYAAVDFDGDIDIEEELKQQMIVARTLRQQIVVNGDVSREAASILSSINNLLSAIHRIMKDLKTIERVQTIEAVTIDVLKEFSPEQQKKFIALLEERLPND